MNIRIILIIIGMGGCLSGFPQSVQGEYDEKVKTLETTLSTLYEVISGDAGIQRDWELFRYLFTDNAHLIPVRKDSSNVFVPSFLTPDEYINNARNWFEKNGFFEKEISRKVDTFGPITHVFSTYASFRSSVDTIPFTRGINSIQMMNDGRRWWILNIYWTSESDDTPIPDRYLLK